MPVKLSFLAIFLVLAALPVIPSADGDSSAAVSVVASSAVSVNPTYSALRQASLSGESGAVENLVIRRDTATFSFKHGTFHFLSPVEGRVTGAVFLGEGEFEMTPFLDIEKRNLAILTGSGSISEKFDRLVLRFTDTTYEEIRLDSTVRTGSPDSAAARALEGSRTLFRRGRQFGRPNVALALLKTNIDARILIDLLSQGLGGFFHAHFNGNRHGDMLYAVDPRGLPFVTPEETVLACFSEGSLGMWTSSHLKDHYQSSEVFNEDHRPVDLLHHKIDATIKGRRIEATSETRFKALVDGARVIPFDLYRELRVSRVSTQSGEELQFIQEDRREDADLFVILPEGMRAGEEYTLKFEYAGDNAVSDSGGGNYTLDARTNWYPNSDFGDRATYELALTTQKGLRMVATGQPVGEKTEGNQTTTQWKSDIPLAVAGFNYGRFKVSSTRDSKTGYLLESFANTETPDYLRDLQRQIEQYERTTGETLPVTLGVLNTTRMMDKARSEAQVAIDLFTTLYGPLPYGRLAMTQQPYFAFGQAWPMLVYMPLASFLDSTHRHQLGLGDATMFFRVVGPHEVAHQWWGHIIGWESYRDQWMSEGFSNFSASMFAQLVYKNDVFLKYWKEQREQITTKNRFGHRPGDVGSVFMGYRLDNAKSGYVAASVMYPKGAFILHMLRMLMWDPKDQDGRFMKMMQDFVKTHYNSNVSTLDFQRAIERHMTPEMDLEGNGSMAWFFRQWVYGTSIPDYKLDYRLADAGGGQTKLTMKITQSNVEPSFMIRVPIYLDTDGRISRLGTAVLHGNGSTDEFEVTLPKRPRKVMLCYYEDVLCTTSDR